VTGDLISMLQVKQVFRSFSDGAFSAHPLGSPEIESNTQGKES
jgi:hypothetical protein